MAIEATSSRLGLQRLVRLRLRLTIWYVATFGLIIVLLGAGLFAVITYPVHITGGTGKFAGAIGDIKNVGEVDLAAQATIFRYSGQVCFAEQD